MRTLVTNGMLNPSPQLLSGRARGAFATALQRPWDEGHIHESFSSSKLQSHLKTRWVSRVFCKPPIPNFP